MGSIIFYVRLIYYKIMSAINVETIISNESHTTDGVEAPSVVVVPPSTTDVAGGAGEWTDAPATKKAKARSEASESKGKGKRAGGKRGKGTMKRTPRGPYNSEPKEGSVVEFVSTDPIVDALLAGKVPTSSKYSDFMVPVTQKEVPDRKNPDEKFTLYSSDLEPNFRGVGLTRIVVSFRKRTRGGIVSVPLDSVDFVRGGHALILNDSEGKRVAVPNNGEAIRRFLFARGPKPIRDELLAMADGKVVTRVSVNYKTGAVMIPQGGLRERRHKHSSKKDEAESLVPSESKAPMTSSSTSTSSFVPAPAPEGSLAALVGRYKDGEVSEVPLVDTSRPKPEKTGSKSSSKPSFAEIPSEGFTFRTLGGESLFYWLARLAGLPQSAVRSVSQGADAGEGEDTSVYPFTIKHWGTEEQLKFIELVREEIRRRVLARDLKDGEELSEGDRPTQTHKQVFPLPEGVDNGRVIGAIHHITRVIKNKQRAEDGRKKLSLCPPRIRAEGGGDGEEKGPFTQVRVIGYDERMVQRAMAELRVQCDAGAFFPQTEVSKEKSKATTTSHKTSGFDALAESDEDGDGDGDGEPVSHPKLESTSTGFVAPSSVFTTPSKTKVDAPVPGAPKKAPVSESEDERRTPSPAPMASLGDI